MDARESIKSMGGIRKCEGRAPCADDALPLLLCVAEYEYECVEDELLLRPVVWFAFNRRVSRAGNSMLISKINTRTAFEVVSL